MTDTAKKETKKETKKDFNAEDVAARVVKELALDENEFKEALREVVAVAIGKEKVTDEELLMTVTALHKNGKLRAALRNVGLVPRPGFFSALFSWHDVEHMRTKGINNKIAGTTSIAAKLAVLTYCAWKGYEYFTR